MVSRDEFVSAMREVKGELVSAIHDDVVGILRADEFKLGDAVRHDQIFNTVADVLHADEFKLGDQRRDIAAIRAKLEA